MCIILSSEDALSTGLRFLVLGSGNGNASNRERVYPSWSFLDRSQDEALQTAYRSRTNLRWVKCSQVLTFSCRL